VCKKNVNYLKKGPKDACIDGKGPNLSLQTRKFFLKEEGGLRSQIFTPTRDSEGKRRGNVRSKRENYLRKCAGFNIRLRLGGGGSSKGG